MTQVLEDFHQVKTDFQEIVKQVEDLKAEQSKLLQDLTKELTKNC